MFSPQKVYVIEGNSNNDSLGFDLFSDIEPLKVTKQKKAVTLTASPKKQKNPNMSPPILNNEAQAMASASGYSFDPANYLAQNYSDKKSFHKASTLLAFLCQNIDKSLLAFGTNGGIFYKHNLVPEARLVEVLQNIANKKSKTLCQGEYYVLSCLTNAPASILAQINQNKLKICNVQQDYKTKGPPMANKVPLAVPKKVPLPPGPTTGYSNVEVKTANPFSVKLVPKPKPKSILKTSVKVMKPAVHTSAVQKKFNAKPTPAWYKIL